ncbi:MAG: plasmid pRiA4b ORF-3 family protein [Burkholderiales bacterium]
MKQALGRAPALTDLDASGIPGDLAGMGVTRIRPAGKLVSPWQLRIELLNVKPAVWRRLLVPASIALPSLHRVFQTALGWTDSHLHEFIINGRRYAAPNPDWNEELKQQNERSVVLSAALGRRSRSFDYVYDFGDHWHHAVVVEDCFIQPRAGYAEFLAAIADPRHAEHQSYLDWLGGSFDAARFDREAVNRALAGGRS